MQNKNLCECGCGKKCKRKFVLGHNRRKPPKLSILCKCGCGEYANPGRIYIVHHTHIGRKVTKETREKISKARIGSKRSIEVRKKLSESHKGQKAWNKGLTKEISKRVAKNCQSIKKGYDEWRFCWNIGLTKETDERLKKASNKQSKSAIKRMKRLQQNGKSYGKEGWYFSKKNNKKIYYRSSYELTAYKILEQLSKVKSYEVEPFAIQYEYDGFKRNTIPDILIVYTDETKELIEVKPKDMLDDIRTKTKLRAMKKHSFKNGWKFSVWTENRLFN